MSELATPRKRGRLPKNTAVLGETVKRRRTGDVLSSSPSTPKTLEAQRHVAVSPRATTSRTMAARQGDGMHSAGANQENNMVAPDLQEDELGLSAGDHLQDGPELSDTIIITQERQRERPQELKATKASGSNRGESTVLPNAEEDGPADVISHGDGMQYSGLQEVSEAPTKGKHGRPRKSKTTSGNALHLSGFSGNRNGTVDDGQNVGLDATHSSVLQDLGREPTRRKIGRLENLASNHIDGLPSPSMNSMLPDPGRQSEADAVEETPMKPKRGRPRKTLVNQSGSGLSSAINGGTSELAEHLTSHEETPTKRKRGRPRKISLPRNESTAASIVEYGLHTSGEGQHSSDTVAHFGKEHQVIRRPISDDTLPSENQLVGIVTPPRRRGRPRKTVNFGGEGQGEVSGVLGFKDILRKSVADATATRDTALGVVHDEDHNSSSSAKLPLTRSGQWLRDDRFPLSWLPQEDSHCMPLNSENVNEFDCEDDPALADAVQLRELPHGPALSQQVGVLKKILLEKLTGKRGVHLVGLDDERGKVRQVLEQTVVAGEGNSMLVIGARGSGKSTLVEKIISEISAAHREDFHTVRLNGFIHTDDRLALREIWRQLGIEMEVEDELTGKASNYADILSSLLALLSHPSELRESTPSHTAKSVIFILNEFDLFASHPRQTLLYNLFDIAQGRKAPVLVLGLTTKIDVVDSLEKRVKSRFSHRHVHLGLSKSLGTFWEICKQALLINKDDIQTAEEEAALMPDQEGMISQIWNSVVEGLGNDIDFRRLLQSIFYTTKGVGDFHVACLLPVINLSPQNLHLKCQDFIENSLAPPESKLHILEGLSDLELSLLIAAARLDIILDTDTCNFNMAYDEYTTLASRVKLQSSASGAAAVGAGSKIWGREVGLGAWERLAEYGLIIPAVGGATWVASGNGVGDVGRMGRMFRVDVGLEEIWQSMPGLGAVMTKWCREI